MSDELRISFEPDNEAAKLFVTNGVDGHNIAVTGHSAYYPVSYFLKSDEGEVLGGLLGMVWGGWLHIKFVWVAEPVRGRGHARRLVAMAEAYARKRGCRGAFLETFSFQARPLYEKLGYSVFGEIKDYPPGHSQYFLSKRL
jgi:ribosomal protein S18 acetylase RimI-like enzyme